MIKLCLPTIVDFLDDIYLPNGYTLKNLTVKEYDRCDHVDKSIDGILVTPAGYPACYDGEPLGVQYDIDMRFRGSKNKLSFIDMHWELPEGVWETVEDALTRVAKTY